MTTGASALVGVTAVLASELFDVSTTSPAVYVTFGVAPPVSAVPSVITIVIPLPSSAVTAVTVFAATVHWDVPSDVLFTNSENVMVIWFVAGPVVAVNVGRLSSAVVVIVLSDDAAMVLPDVVPDCR